jgi:hypothetical protein
MLGQVLLLMIVYSSTLGVAVVLMSIPRPLNVSRSMGGLGIELM